MNNIEDIFSGGYIEQMEKFKKEAFKYTIDDREVTEKEFINYILKIIKEGKRKKNERNTKENNI